MQLAIHVVQNRHAETQNSFRGKTNKRQTILNGNFLCLSCPSATFASQLGGFVPREWQGAKDLFGLNNDKYSVASLLSMKWQNELTNTFLRCLKRVHLMLSMLFMPVFSIVVTVV